MKKAAIAAVILALVMTLTSCGSKDGTANTNNVPTNKSSTNANITKSVEGIDDTMKSIETTVDSLEDAVDINLDNL
jgi:peptidoglycan hydrolase CwlO-like protein